MCAGGYTRKRSDAICVGTQRAAPPALFPLALRFCCVSMGKCLLCALACTHKCTRALREDKRGREKRKTEHVGVWVCVCREREGGRARTRKRGGERERGNTRDRGCGRKKVNTHKTARETKTNLFHTLFRLCNTTAALYNALQHTAAHCNTLDYSTLQQTTTTLQHTATLQHAATHCSTLQHTCSILFSETISGDNQGYSLSNSTAALDLPPRPPPTLRFPPPKALCARARGVVMCLAVGMSLAATVRVQ